ncbi:8288_t:CDS:10 [Diversispora eburnea]|uniref:8288_t:CDS:1 n=1 Tax=Diversispora eburnea TaxID=1213867 RepID=A0A9N9FNI3_9GLOM|nr:8288_t:CDS:10 [Diversispora eburnea]
MGHLQNFVNKFIEKHGNETEVLNVKSVTSAYTYDGVDVCGERIALEIVKKLASFKKQHDNTKKITKISFIGYSLGGLMARYAIGILYKNGIFNEITPMRSDDRYLTKVINWTTSNLMSNSGEQLQYIDNFKNMNEPLLYILSNPNKIFYKALTKFKKLVLFANGIDIIDMISLQNNNDDDDNDSISLDSYEATKHDSSFKKQLPRYLLFAAATPFLVSFGVPIIFEFDNYDDFSYVNVKNRIKINDENDGNIVNGTNNGISDGDNNKNNKFMNKITNVENEIIEVFRPVNISERQKESLHNLNTLNWNKHSLLIDSVHPHAAIICRNRLYQGGHELINYFLEKIFEV